MMIIKNFTVLFLAVNLSLDSTVDAATRRLKGKKGKKGKKEKGEKPKKNEYDVVVVGSGISGMSAAYELEKAGKNVIVVEAMDRIGGRMFGREVAPNQFVDFGGQWLGKTHEHLEALVEDLGIEYFPAPSPLGGNKNVLLYKNVLYEYSSFVASVGYFPFGVATDQLVAQGFSRAEMDEVNTAFQDFIDLADATIDLGGFPTDPSLREYDLMSYGDYFRPKISSDVGRYISNLFPATNGCCGPSDGSETSLLHKLWAVKNFSPLDEPEKYLLHGGAGQIPAKIEEKLTHPVLTGNPVVSIDQTGDVAVVRTLKGKELRAKDGVIVAMPPVMANRITFYPPLPASYHQLAMHMPMGTVAKVLISYSSPFWLDKGLSAFGSTDLESNNVCGFFGDVSDPRSGKGVISILITAEHYDMVNAIEGEEERKDRILNDLAALLGEEAKEPETFDLADWPAEQFIQGSYAAYMTPLGWTRFGDSMATKFGMVSWAGTDTSDVWPGYFEGGIQAGIRAANEVIGWR